MYNPKINPQNSNNRRSVVLKQMVKNGFLTEEEYLNKRVKQSILIISEGRPL
ncbi:MAG: hypothetical protein IPJ13_07030 [Saprospiraceae bacterium]|nr:hypothetical protein [Saprospiraceae bacterium]